MPSEKVAVALVVEPAKKPGELPYWAASWRADGRPVKRRLGPAWLAPKGSAEAKDKGREFGRGTVWVTRKGRVPAHVLDEAEARRQAEDLQASWAQSVAEEERDRVRRAQTFRMLAREWQAHMIKTGAHRAATAYDIECTLREPGTAHKRGGGESRGLVMRRLGDVPAHEITYADIEELLDEYEELGRAGRTINKIRENLRAIFNYGMDARRGWNLESNPAELTDKRKEVGSGGVKFFEIEQVEAIAAAAAAGKWRVDTRAAYNRSAHTIQNEQQENDQLAELIRFAAYTGLRQGELVVLQWSDINLKERTCTVERALSGNTIGPPKSGKTRVVPLGAPAYDALKRLRKRPNFTGPDEYVFATIVGERPDPSALRQRYNQARDAAGVPPLTFHGLRHTAASLLIRRLDVQKVKAIMGHASIKTTERYLHAVRAADLVDDVTEALTSTSVSEGDRLAKQLLALEPEAREQLLEQIAAAA